MFSSSQSQPNESLDTVGIDTLSLAANTSRHGKKLFNLMKSETELRWIHQIQFTNVSPPNSIIAYCMENLY